MLFEKKDGVYQLELLAKEKSLIHGFSSRELGNMNTLQGQLDVMTERRKKFGQILGIKSENFVYSDQVHGSKIKKVTTKDRGQVISETDGLITNDKEVYLFIVGADCPNILFFDPVKKVVGAAHAGWEGTLARIAEKMIGMFKKDYQSDPQNIKIGFSPSIGPCCYEVQEERIEKFKKAFGDEYGLYRQTGDKFYLDLGYINYRQLTQSGVSPENIGMAATCTQCHAEQFFSFRGDLEKFGRPTGEMGSLIGLKKE